MTDPGQREIYRVGTELMHGKPGGYDMQPFNTDDLGSALEAATDPVYEYVDEQNEITSNNLRGAALVTATADGLTTGTISVTSKEVHVAVTSGDANHIVVLPATASPVIVYLINGATGYELRSSDPATIGINGGTGAAAESAIAASTLVTCYRTTATNWVCMSQTSAGVVSATQVAAP